MDQTFGPFDADLCHYPQPVRAYGVYAEVQLGRNVFHGLAHAEKTHNLEFPVRQFLMRRFLDFGFKVGYHLKGKARIDISFSG